ncbi:MAG: DUF4031 domain-containing protein [Pseudomonadota bacterium]
MPVYVDHMRAPFRGRIMCHMVADRLDELMAMADRIGMQRRWFQPLSHPHFDIDEPRRALAVHLGAVEVGRRDLVAALRRHRALWQADPQEAAAIRAAGRAARHPAFLAGEPGPYG